jgi:hypothetical protein
MSVRVLSFHASYGCKHRGRCCSSGWPITVEPAELVQLRNGGLMPAGPAPDGPTLLASSHGECEFHDRGREGGCRIQREMGHAALPLACRQFPRQSVRDPRGVSVTLSHYCPTAAELLAASGEPMAIAVDAPGFPVAGEYVGLTADPALPPLLHARLAMDWESWWLFEELAIALISDMPDPLGRLALFVEDVREWKVGQRPLMDHIRGAFGRVRERATVPALPSPAVVADRCADAIGAVPEQWRPQALNATSASSASFRLRSCQSYAGQAASVPEVVTRRYLAAHAFANWTAYQGEGLCAWYRSVETAACLLAHTADPGRADLILRHLADASALTARWNRAERA